MNTKGIKLGTSTLLLDISSARVARRGTRSPVIDPVRGGFEIDAKFNESTPARKDYEQNLLPSIMLV